MRGKLIVIEGTDCSGKETQTKLLMSRLREEGINVNNFSFPNYSSPTGKIIGGPYLGKENICPSFFEEGASNVDPKVASLYYAADRKYNIEKLEFLINNGANLILDRYIYSNMAHQGGKIEDKKIREEMYDWLYNLEFNLLEFPKPDLAIYLHMPTEKTALLKNNRENLDAHEKDENHLKHAEIAYEELAQKYNFKKVECTSNDKIRSIEDINNEVYEIVKNCLTK